MGTMPRPAGRVTVDGTDRMSIAPILAAATQPAASRVAEIAGWAVLILLLPGLRGGRLPAGLSAGARRPGRCGSRPAGRSGRWWSSGSPAGAVWMGSSTAYVAFKQLQLMSVAGPAGAVRRNRCSRRPIGRSSPPSRRRSASSRSWPGTCSTTSRRRAWLGFLDRRLLGKGVRAGLLGALIAVPWTIVSGGLLGAAVSAHRLSTPDRARAAAEDEDPRRRPPSSGRSCSARCVVAPLFEELLFRGHLQTLIRRGLVMLTHPRRSRDGPEDLPPPVPYRRRAMLPDPVPISARPRRVIAVAAFPAAGLRLRPSHRRQAPHACCSIRPRRRHSRPARIRRPRRSSGRRGRRSR